MWSSGLQINAAVCLYSGRLTGFCQQFLAFSVSSAGISLVGMALPHPQVVMNQARTEELVRLLSVHQDRLFRYVFALLPHEPDARDVLQETCVALCRKFEEYDRAKPFLPWAYRFAYLEVLKHRQRNSRGVQLSADVLELLAHERSEQEQLLDERLHALEQCLRELPPQDSELIRGRYHAKLPIDQLAEQVAMSQRTLLRNLDRVRHRLFECITRRLAAEGPR